MFWIKIMPLQIIRLLCLLSLLLSAPLSWGSAYEAPLPEGLKTDPAMCKYLNCADVLPGATLFSDRKGQPPYVEG